MTQVTGNAAADYAQKAFGENNKVTPTKAGDAIVTPKPVVEEVLERINDGRLTGKDARQALKFLSRQ